MSVSYSIPAYLSDFSSNDTDNRTTAKLKVFYVGETGDGRVFDKEFADYLAQSLPCTPVVAFFSDMKKDFIGHNSTQYIYGIVRPDAEWKFEKDENNVEWLITDVLLYTDRIDNIGEVAKKIVGHAHSLEMDPNTVEYEIVKKDGKRSIHFTKARLLGLSVLGDDQKPAFTGSEFFTEDTQLRERFENFFSCLQQKDRGVSMDKNEKFAQLLKFYQMSYTEKERAIENYVHEQMGDDVCPFVAEMWDDRCVIGFYHWQNDSFTYSRYNYTIDEQGVALTDGVDCFRRFVTAADIQLIEDAQNAATTATATDPEPTDPVTDPATATENTEGQSAEDPASTEDPATTATAAEGEGNSTPADPAITEPEPQANATQTVEGPEDPATDPTEASTTCSTTENNEGEPHGEEGSQTTQTQENFTSDPSTLSDSERAELNEFRFQKKINLINSYNGDLSAETIRAFTDKANELTYEELEAQLAIEFRKFSKTHQEQRTVPFSFVATNDNPVTSAKSYADLVKAQLRRK